MADHFNGSSFEMGRLWGQLQGHMHHHGQALERQNEILLDIKDSLNDLPTRMVGTMTATQGSAKPRLLPELTALFKALMPLITILSLAMGRITWTDLASLIGF